MADELIQAGIFEGMTWWNTNPSKNFFPTGGLSPSPYCSMAVGGEGLAATWAVGDHQIVNNINMGVLGSTGRSTVQRSSPSAHFFDQDPHMMDSSTLQAMRFDAPAWNHQEDIMHGGSSEGDYNTATMLGDVNPNTIMQAGEWSTTFGDLNCTSSPPTAINSSGNSSGSTDGSTLTCDGKIPVVNSFPVDPSSLFPSSLLSGDFKSSDHEILPPCDWGTNATQVSPGSSFNQQEQIINHIRATLLGASPCSSLPSSPKPQSRKKITNPKVNKNEEDCDSASLDLRNAVEPMFKRQRIETPSSLPTFKVRKEKLGDRITALQQLVSPFGKTDTASVLHEAIEYIKFLHDQVHGLSTPYMKNGAPMQHPHQQKQGNHNPRSKSEGEVANQDLRSRGLCLVPISSTFPVAHETPADFWTPTFGATFR